MVTDRNRASEIEDRMIDFGVRAIKLTAALPASFAGQHVAKQLLRSATAPAAHYAKARGAESKADFIHKLRIGLKELNETTVWLRMICRSEMMKPESLVALLDENQQLCRIVNASIQTAKRGTADNDK